MFIHDAVLESLTCGDTQISASGLSNAIEKLKEKDRVTGRTGFETQFHVCYIHLCTQVTIVLEFEYSNGTTTLNVDIEMLFLPKTTGSWSGNSKTYRSH